MLGVYVNAVLIIFGSILGLLLRRFITERISKVMMLSLGFCTFLIGLKMALNYNNVFVLVLSMVLGGIIGELLQIEQRMHDGVNKLMSRVIKNTDSSFTKGFVIASTLFCTGAMAIVGSINSGLSHNHEILFSKAILDGVISITFAGIYGIGVAFSSVSIFLYQGLFVLLSQQLEFLSSQSIINDISGVGGLLVMMIGLDLAQIKETKVANFLPAVFIVFGLSTLFELLN